MAVFCGCLRGENTSGAMRGRQEAKTKLVSVRRLAQVVEACAMSREPLCGPAHSKLARLRGFSDLHVLLKTARTSLETAPCSSVREELSAVLSVSVRRRQEPLLLVEPSSSSLSLYFFPFFLSSTQAGGAPNGYKYKDRFEQSLQTWKRGASREGHDNGMRGEEEVRGGLEFTARSRRTRRRVGCS